MSTGFVDFSYEPFSREPEYLELNRQFIHSLPLEGRHRILDLACGTGTLTELILEAVRPALSAKGSNGNDTMGLKIIGLDLSRQSLRVAQTQLAEMSLMPAYVSGLLEASADCLPFPEACADAALMGNAIQLLDDKDRLVGEAARVLSSGGLFAFNTSFYAGTYVRGTEQFYLDWVGEAIAYLKRKDEELKRAGERGIVRRKGLAGQAFSKPWLSRGQYEQMLERHGFKVTRVFERTVMLTQRSFETIGSYAGLASVLLSGYPVTLACEALEKAAGPAMAKSKKEAIPRYWLEMSAVKSA